MPSWKQKTQYLALSIRLTTEAVHHLSNVGQRIKCLQSSTSPTQHALSPTGSSKSFILDSAHHRSNAHSLECGKKNSLPLIQHITCNVPSRKHHVRHPASSIRLDAEAKHHLSDVRQRTRYHWFNTSLSQHAFSWTLCQSLDTLDQAYHRSNTPSRKCKAKNAMSRSRTSLAIWQTFNSALDFLHHQSSAPPKRNTFSLMKDKELSVVDLTHHSRNMPSRKHRVQRSVSSINHPTEAVQYLSNAEQRTLCHWSSTSLATYFLADFVLNTLSHRSGKPPKWNTISQRKDKEHAVIEPAHHSGKAPSPERPAQWNVSSIRQTTEVEHLLSST
jgi:hypothetical protein